MTKIIYSQNFHMPIEYEKCYARTKIGGKKTHHAIEYLLVAHVCLEILLLFYNLISYCLSNKSVPSTVY